MEFALDMEKAKLAKPVFFFPVVEYVVLPILMMIFCPMMAFILPYITNSVAEPTFGAFVQECSELGSWACAVDVLHAHTPSLRAVIILGTFAYLALLLYWWPGMSAPGPVTPKGHTPVYTDNGIAHCILFVITFIGASDVGFGCFPLSILFDEFEAMIGTLNLFALAVCAGLYIKGMHAPSGPDVRALRQRQPLSFSFSLLRFLSHTFLCMHAPMCSERTHGSWRHLRLLLGH